MVTPGSGHTGCRTYTTPNEIAALPSFARHLDLPRSATVRSRSARRRRTARRAPTRELEAGAADRQRAAAGRAVARLAHAALDARRARAPDALVIGRAGVGEITGLARVLIAVGVRRAVERGILGLRIAGVRRRVGGPDLVEVRVHRREILDGQVAQVLPRHRRGER